MAGLDEDAFCEFVAARSMALLRAAYALTGDQHHAEDLVQTALTKLARRWSKVSDPEAYVRRILFHEQVNRWRRRATWEEPVSDVPDGSVADCARYVTDRLTIQRALLKLGPRQRAVLYLKFYEDMSESQIAGLLDTSLGTVRSQTSRALARLRVLVPELDDSIDDSVSAGTNVIPVTEA